MSKKTSNNLDEYLKKKNITRYKLSKKCGVSETTLSFLNRNIRSINFETANKIASGLNISLDELNKILEGVEDEISISN